MGGGHTFGGGFIFERLQYIIIYMHVHKIYADTKYHCTWHDSYAV